VQISSCRSVEIHLTQKDLNCEAWNFLVIFQY